MTVFKKTLFGKLLGGIGKGVKAIAAPAIGLLTGGPVGALAGASSSGLFGKIGKIFKKKAPGAGTVLGNYANDALAKASAAAMQSIGKSAGSGTQMIATELAAMSEGQPATPFSQGVKEGFITESWKKYKVPIIIVGVLLTGGLIFIFVSKKGGRR
jgi:hypothetical protein